MEGSKRSLSKKQSTPQFKRKGGSRKERWNNSSHDKPSGDSLSSETVYRILCHSRKIGSVIGKGGSIVQTLREETQAKITVADSVPGSDERVIKIYSSSTKLPKHSTEIEDEILTSENENDLMEPHCAAQVALLKVHERIIEEDIEDGNDNVVTARLLVPNNMVGCLLGKKGDVIQKLRSETGANIRVLPADHLPICAMTGDELVQISGKPAVARRALYEVSTLLHQNPRKDQPPIGPPMPHGNHGFYPHRSPIRMPPPGNSVWSQRNASSHGMPPPPWMGRYENEPSGFGPGVFDGVPGGHDGGSATDFFMKILCSATKIGGVIGKGGCNVKQIQQETGASIHVEDVSPESDERVIRVSSTELPWSPRSQTIDAILYLQNKTSEFSEKGTTITRLLVPSSKVGCLLGQGGHVINEMRRRTQADIRVYSKEDKPKCAAEDEELVQISGNFDIAKDALAEIASRLRERCLRDAKALGEPAHIGPHSGYGRPENIRSRGPPPSGFTGVGSSGVYNPYKDRVREYESNREREYELSRGREYELSCGREYEPIRGHEYEPIRGVEYEPGHGREYEPGRAREYEPASYPVYPNATGYPSVGRAMEVKMPNNAVGSVMAPGRNNTNDVAGARLKLQDPMYSSSESFVEMRNSQHLNNAQSMHHTYMASDGQNQIPQHGSYQDFNTRGQNYNPQHGSYPDPSARNQQTSTHPQHGSYQDFGARGQNNPQHGSYHDLNAQQPSYATMNASQTPYQSTTPQQSTYQNYQNLNSQAPYQSVSAQNSYQY